MKPVIDWTKKVDRIKRRLSIEDYQYALTHENTLFRDSDGVVTADNAFPEGDRLKVLKK